jgi:predicted Zn-dependent protease
MERSSKRLEFLLQLTGSAKSGQGASSTKPGTAEGDAFAWYGLAMEYRALERPEEALSTFATLRERVPGYVPMYLMCGQLLETMGRKAEARAWLTAGVEAAREKGDAHSASELESALAAL